MNMERESEAQRLKVDMKVRRDRGRYSGDERKRESGGCEKRRPSLNVLRSARQGAR
jgi:hypothetical protein